MKFQVVLSQGYQLTNTQEMTSFYMGPLDQPPRTSGQRPDRQQEEGP